jgi:hypothetical protein
MGLVFVGERGGVEVGAIALAEGILEKGGGDEVVLLEVIAELGMGSTAVVEVHGERDEHILGHFTNELLSKVSALGKVQILHRENRHTAHGTRKGARKRSLSSQGATTCNAASNSGKHLLKKVG